MAEIIFVVFFIILPLLIVFFITKKTKDKKSFYDISDTRKKGIEKQWKI